MLVRFGLSPVKALFFRPAGLFKSLASIHFMCTDFTFLQVSESSGFVLVRLLSEALEQRMNALVCCCGGFAASILIFHVDGVICTRHGAHGAGSS